MDIADLFYPSGLLPAAPVKHGYKNFWVRDGYYVGLCLGGAVRDRLWEGMIGVLDHYKWKLEYHSKIPPKNWYEYIHVRYSPEGREIGNEPWQHNQFDAYANWGEVALDVGRGDLAGLLVDYLQTIQFHRSPAAGAWEDRNTCDAYTLAACIHFLQRAKRELKGKRTQIDEMVRRATRRLYTLLPFATLDKTVCLSVLGVIWPFDVAGPYRQDILDLVSTHLVREPFGCIRYVGDTYDGEGFDRTAGNELPWLLGDCFMAKIDPKRRWSRRLAAAQSHFGMMPESFFPENHHPNRNSPLVWADAMFQSLA